MIAERLQDRRQTACACTHRVHDLLGTHPQEERALSRFRETGEAEVAAGKARGHGVLR
jgi:hypothetical protein